MITIAYRLAEEMIDRIDLYAAQRAVRDGRPCSRSEAIRLLLEQALEKAPAPPVAGEVIDVESSKVIEPVRTEVIKGNITDPPFEPVPKEKKTQPPHRRQDRIPGAAFEEATERLESSPKKKPPNKKGALKWPRG